MGVWYGICGRTGNLKDFDYRREYAVAHVAPAGNLHCMSVCFLFMVIVKRTGQRDVFLYDHHKKNGIGDGCFNNEKRE